MFDVGLILQQSFLDDTFYIIGKFVNQATSLALPNLQVSAKAETFLNNRKLRHVSHKFGSAEFASVSSADTFLSDKICFITAFSDRSVNTVFLSQSYAF